MSRVSTDKYQQVMLKFIPFSKIQEFFTKIYGFFKKFFSQKNQLKKLHQTVPTN